MGTWVQSLTCVLFLGLDLSIPVKDFLGSDVPDSYLETIIDEADVVRDKR